MSDGQISHCCSPYPEGKGHSGFDNTAHNLDARGRCYCSIVTSLTQWKSSVNDVISFIKVTYQKLGRWALSQLPFIVLLRLPGHTSFRPNRHTALLSTAGILDTFGGDSRHKRSFFLTDQDQIISHAEDGGLEQDLRLLSLLPTFRSAKSA